MNAIAGNGENGWISVKDALPKKEPRAHLCDQVLIAVDFGEFEYEAVPAILVGGPGDDPRWWMLANNGSDPARENPDYVDIPSDWVTHWRPFPKLPELKP